MRVGRREFLAAGVKLPLFQHAPSTQAADWEDVSSGIFEMLPVQTSHQNRLFRGVGNLITIPGSGELFVTLNGEHGMFRSSDGGQNWARAQAPVRGRAYGGFSASLDPATGRFAVFMITGPVTPMSAMTTDGGKSWMPITRPTGIRHDGWTWGSADWASRDPQVILGKQHHDLTAFWLSRDRGQTWTKIPFRSRNPGVVDEGVLVATGGAEGNGIFRSEDQGATWTQVSAARIHGKTPVRWGNRMYWTGEDGVIVSEDAGRTWGLLGSSVRGALWGPHFGRKRESMMVVAQDGFYISTDDGVKWRRVAPWFGGGAGDAVRYDIMHPTISFGWDEVCGLLYCAPVGGGVYRRKIPNPMP